jgi:tetratricopeptide (TPR) repeat protein
MQTDSNELVNLADVEPDIASEMEATLARFEEQYSSGSARYAAQRPDYDPEMVRKMRALGYLGDAQRRLAKLPEPGGDLPDPKSEMAKLHAKQKAGGHLRVAAALMLNGEFEAALERVRQAERVAPDYAEVQATRGLILVRKGELNEGIRLLQLAIESDPRAQMVFQTLNNLGLAYLQQGRCEEAIDAIERSLKLEPDYQNALYNLGLANETCGNPEEAVRAYRAFIEAGHGIDPAMRQSLRHRIEALESSRAD